MSFTRQTTGVIKSITKSSVNSRLLIEVQYPVDSQREKPQCSVREWVRPLKECVELLGAEVPVVYEFENPSKAHIGKNDLVQTQRQYCIKKYNRFKDNGYKPIRLFGSWCLVRHKSKNYTKFSYYRPFNLAKRF